MSELGWAVGRTLGPPEADPALVVEEWTVEFLGVTTAGEQRWVVLGEVYRFADEDFARRRLGRARRRWPGRQWRLRWRTVTTSGWRELRDSP